VTEESLPAKVDRAFEKASEFYGDELIPIRAAITSIPLIGGGIDLILASEGQRAAKRRLTVLLAAMKERMEQLEESAVDREYLESDEFIDLVLKAFDSATRTRDDEKIRLYARILTESTIRYKREGYSPEEYLHLIADLTPKDLRIARAFYGAAATFPVREEDDDELEASMEAWRRRSEELCKKFDLDYEELLFFLNRIEAVGLVRGVGHTYPGRIAQTYVMTSAFKRLMEFLEFSE
jgi:hypothetical protein